MNQNEGFLEGGGAIFWPPFWAADPKGTMSYRIGQRTRRGQCPIEQRGEFSIRPSERT